MTRIGRNEPCPCGSGKKYKKCCYGKDVVDGILFSSDLGKDLREEMTIIPNTGKVKMSEILLEFAEPLTDACENNKSFINAINLSMIAWNISFFPKKERKELMDESIEKFTGDRHDKRTIKNILSMMQERKEKEFSHIKMMMVDLEITFKDGNHQLNVLSAPINEEWDPSVQ